MCICMNLRSLASCVRRRHFVTLGYLASRHRFGITCAGSGSAKPCAAGLPGAGKNTRCTVSAFTHTYYGPYLQDISASSRHGGQLVLPPPHLVHRCNQGRGRCGFRGRRQSHAVHGNCFYTRVLWAILTGYVGWFAARPPRTAAAARSCRTCSVVEHGTWPVRCSRATAKSRDAW